MRTGIRKHQSPSSRHASIDALEPRVMMTATNDAGPESSAGIGQPAVLSPAENNSLPELHQVTGVDAAHRAGLTGAGQTIAIIDSGVAYDHPALGGGLGGSYRVVGGWDFTEENDADPYDDGPAGYHGTHVAGIIASHDPQHLGVAPEADIVALRVFNDMGRGKLSWLESSLQWVIDNHQAFEHPITTVNMSIGMNWNSLEIPDYANLEDELQQLHEMGIFVSAAAGNRFDADQGESKDVGLSYPAVSPHTIAAASTNASGQLSDFSQRYSEVLAVPGESVTSTVPDFLEDFNGKTDDFYAASGTSMAAPYLAGASVLVRQALAAASQAPVTVDAIYDLLTSTADRFFDPVTEQYFRHVNVGRAIESLLPDAPVTQQNDELIVLGTEGNDTIHVDQRGFVRINGTRYDFNPDTVHSVHVTGNGGADRLTIDVRESHSIARFRNNSVSIVGGDTPVHADGFDRIDVLAQTNDLQGEFLGSVHKDRLFVKPTHSWMTSQQFVGYLRGAVQVTGWANDASDTVVLYDGPGNDTARVTPDRAEMQAGNFVAYGHGYSTYVLRAQHGGDDIVTLEGTQEDDQARSKPEYVSLKTDTHFAYAKDFESRVIVGGGGTDSARLFDGPGNDQFETGPQESTIVTGATQTTLRHFTRVDAKAIYGSDSVTFVGGAAGESFVAKPFLSWANFGASLHSATGFDQTVINAGAGEDSVTLYDSIGSDQFSLSPTYATASGPGFRYQVNNAENVHAFASHGHDTVQLVDSQANDRLFADADRAWMRGYDFTNLVDGFDRVEANSTAGSDRMILAAVLANIDETEFDLFANGWLESGS